MRVAIIPNPTFRDLEGESEFLMVRQFARDVLQARKDVYFYVVVPHWCHLPKMENGIHYLIDEHDSCTAFHERIATVPMQFSDWFSARKGKYPVDAIFTTRSAAVSMMVKYLRDFRDKSQIPVFIDENMALDSSLPLYFVGAEDLIARSLGYANASHNFFDTTWEQERAVRAARRYITATYVKKMTEKSSVVPCGVNIKRIDELIKDVKRSRKFQVLCGNRLNASKRPEQVVKLYNQFYAFGRNVRVVLSTPETGAFLSKLQDKVHMKLYKKLNSDDFVRLAAQSHVVVETTRFGGFSLGLSEMILAGPVVIMPHLKWIRSIVGEELWAGYPFFYENFTEAATLMRYAFENFKEADEKMMPMRKFWRENYDSAVMSLKMFEQLEKNVLDVPGSGLWSPGNVALIEAGMEQMHVKEGLKKIDLELLYMFMVNNSRAMKASDLEHPLRGRLSKWSIYRWLGRNGWKDLCSGPRPVFVRQDS